MTGRKKTTIALIAVGLIVAIACAFFFLNRDDKDSESKKSAQKPNTSSSTTTSRPANFTEESTTTALPLDEIFLSLSTPYEGQEFNNTPVSVRAIIAGTTSGTCSLEFTKSGANTIELEAPLIAAPTYFTCEGFDIEQSRFSSKGEWNLELKVTSKEGKTKTENRKITVS